MHSKRRFTGCQPCEASFCTKKTLLEQSEQLAACIFSFRVDDLRDAGFVQLREKPFSPLFKLIVHLLVIERNEAVETDLLVGRHGQGEKVVNRLDR
ncbi:hypothetical protein D3C84_992140 [compost metagenome]